MLCPELVAVFFDAKGNYLGCEERPWGAAAGKLAGRKPPFNISGERFRELIAGQIKAWQAELERQPVEFLGRRQFGLLADARATLGAYLGVDADDVAYVSNVTTALNIVARSLPLEPGDEILTADHEYGALERTWTFVAEHRQGDEPADWRTQRQ